MYRRVLPYLTLVVVLACNVDSTTQPTPPLASSASPLISDGAHGAGNPDFFFVSPTAPNPKNLAAFGDNEFNGSLLPLVNVCELNVSPPATPVAGTPCNTAPGSFSTSFELTAANVDMVAEKYQVDWTIPVSPDVYYRITVLIGTDTLGYVDVATAATSKELKDFSTNSFVPRTDGSDLPIKFRIEEFALCETPGAGPCESETVNLTTGGTVSTTFEGDDHPTGVDIQPGSGTGNTTITIEECADLNPRETDLPTYGKCARITADPPLTAPLAQAAVVFICNAVDDIGTSLSAAQRGRVTLHRFDESTGGGDPDSLTALPHADPEACDAPPPSIGLGQSLKGIVADLRHGRFKSAGGRLAGIVSPKPLYAAVLDEGGGGLSFIFSDFQFALPAKMHKVASTDNQVAPPGTLATSPKVIVTDVEGDPVANARVRFGGTTEAACLAVPITEGVMSSATDGSASKSWTIVEGSNTLVACGRGIADADEATNGPRTGDGAFDPFQPIQTPFDETEPPGGPVEEPVLVGSVTFTATAGVDVIVLNDINIFDNSGMANTENVDFLTGVLTYSAAGTRASQTVVMFDAGRSTALCTEVPSVPYCPHASGPGSGQFTSLRASITGMGLTISDVSSSSVGTNTVLRSIPSNVKAIFLWMPIEFFAYDEINALKAFVGEGGRLVYLGENDGAYGATAGGGFLNGDGTQDSFLADMGSAMTRTGGAHDPGGVTLSNSSLTLSPSSSDKHPIMTNVTSLFVAASADVALGAVDATLFRDSGNAVVLGAVARVSLTPISPPVSTRVMPRNVVAQRAASLNATTQDIDFTTGRPPR